MTIVTPSKQIVGIPYLTNRPVSLQVAAALFGTAFLALCSYVEVPLVPVPLTLQTLAISLVGALYGWRLGSITITAWLIEGALGMPVLAGGGAGAHHFVGPTAGYLFAFPIAGAMMGWLAERGWDGSNITWAFAGMILTNAVCLLLGAAWLGVTIGAGQALLYGVWPFLTGAILKSALGAAVLKAFALRGRRGTE